MLDIAVIATVGTPYLSVIPPIFLWYVMYKKKIPIILNPINVGLIILAIWAFYSGLVNKSIISTAGSLGLLLYFSVDVYLQSEFNSEDKVNTLLEKVWVYSLFACILGLIEKMASFFVDMTWISDLFFKGPYVPTIENYRIYSTFGNPNVAGAWFAAMVLVSLYLFEKSESFKKIVYLVSMVCFVLALVFTGSRGATAGLEIAILVYALFRKNRNTRVVLILTFVVVLVLAIMSPEINHSLNTREQIWEKCIDLFLEKPITGWGAMGIWYSIGKTHAHNIWISMLSMFGIVGLLCYLWIKASVFRSLVILSRQSSTLVPLLASVQALIIGHGVVDFVIMAPQCGIMFFACSSIIVRLAANYQSSPSYPEIIFEDMGYHRKLSFKKDQ